MPRYTIHIRDEDNDKWLSIPNRPEWLHKKLNQPSLRDLGFVRDISEGEMFTVWQPEGLKKVTDDPETTNEII